MDDYRIFTWLLKRCTIKCFFGKKYLIMRETGHKLELTDEESTYLKEVFGV